MATPEKAQAEAPKSLILLYPHATSGNAYLQQLRGALQSDASLQLHDAQSDKDIAEQLVAAGHGLLVFCIRQKEDLTLVLNMMASLSKYIKSKALRVIGVNEINHPQIPEMLMKRGCADLFPSKLAPKALRHKINTALRIVATYSVPGSPLPQQETQAASKKAQAASQSGPQQSLLKNTPALALASDCWLVRKERDLRRVQGRWIVDLIGPGPSSGIWEERPGSSGTLWEFKPRALADGSVGDREFVKDEGAWVYSGRKPEFVWDLGRWRFLGERLELSFRKGGEILACRFRLLDDGTMEYADNSPQAKQKLPLIIKSIENEVRFRDEAKAKSQAASKFRDEVREGNIVNWEKDDPGDGPELNVHLEKPEEIPFNQAPKPKLTIWIAPAQPREGEKFRPMQAHPIELSAEHLLLEVPAGRFQEGNAVILVMDDGLMKPESRSRLKGTLNRVEAGDETDTATIAIDPQIITVLAPIHRMFEMRQQEIQDFLKAARGW